MNVRDITFYSDRFSIPDIVWDLKTEIECPECKKWFTLEQWKEAEAGCEECGSHPAIACPDNNCWTITDLVFVNRGSLNVRQQKV